MDRLIYTTMTGAKQVMEQQATVSHNMANAATTGFRAQLDSFRAVPVEGKGLATRTQVVDETTGADYSQGAIAQTGRSLDMAIDGSGWIAVQGTDGKEAYTRSGSLKINQNGLLQTQAGELVLGDSGPLSIPYNSSLMIGKDGTISQETPGVIPVTMEVVGQIKLVNPPADTLKRGDDGLFRSKDGSPAVKDPAVNAQGGALEASNVNVVEAMVRMIGLGRQFEMNMTLLKNVESNATKASQIMNIS
jgi:flagellar basal-body rod protein FlgF